MRFILLKFHKFTTLYSADYVFTNKLALRKCLILCRWHFKFFKAPLSIPPPKKKHVLSLIGGFFFLPYQFDVYAPKVFIFCIHLSFVGYSFPINIQFGTICHLFLQRRFICLVNLMQNALDPYWELVWLAIARTVSSVAQWGLIKMCVTFVDIIFSFNFMNE